ncbi:putative PhiRv2 prophage protease [Mycobacterium canetti]|uniref:hypothetical protein n=1 Tax=Mycobacterium canetti TaxID=78331 RepID=UPI002D77A065|nr:hypothetical protein [Mycobacterium canetti]WRO42730.1 putative PhiRv2 prophage protease [Mycobacterium canetti]
MNTTDRVRALCCQCGTTRTFSPRYSFPWDANYSRDAGPDREPHGWRMTGTLKCSTCRARTRHAVLRDDQPGHRDHAETVDREQSVVAHALAAIDHLESQQRLSRREAADWRHLVESLAQAATLRGLWPSLLAEAEHQRLADDRNE